MEKQNLSWSIMQREKRNIASAVLHVNDYFCSVVVLRLFANEHSHPTLTVTDAVLIKFSGWKSCYFVFRHLG